MTARTGHQVVTLSGGEHETTVVDEQERRPPRGELSFTIVISKLGPGFTQALTRRGIEVPKDATIYWSVGTRHRGNAAMGAAASIELAIDAAKSAVVGLALGA